jgi:hypothetical protein
MLRCGGVLSYEKPQNKAGVNGPHRESGDCGENLHNASECTDRERCGPKKKSCAWKARKYY